MLCVWVLCLYAWLCTTYWPNAHRGPKRASDQWIVVLDGCKTPCWWWESILGPMEHQSLLLITKKNSHSQNLLFFMCISILSVCIFVHHRQALCQWRPESCQNPWSYSSRKLWAVTQMLGTEFFTRVYTRVLPRAICILRSWAISSIPNW